MSRVYAVEATPTLIGAAGGPPLRRRTRRDARGGQRARRAWRARRRRARRCAGLAARRRSRTCKAAHGRAFIHAGPDLPAEAHALIHAVNEALGGRGNTYDLLEPPLLRRRASMADLRADMEAGRVEQLLVLDCNAAFTAPGFEQAMRAGAVQPQHVHRRDETAAAADLVRAARASVRGLGRRAGA